MGIQSLECLAQTFCFCFQTASRHSQGVKVPLVSKHVEEIQPKTRLFAIETSFRGGSPSTIPLKLKANEEFIKWSIEAIHALYQEITRINGRQYLWRLHSRGDAQVQIMQLPFSNPPPKIVFDRTVRAPEPFNLSDNNQDLLPNRLRTNSQYGTIDQEPFSPKAADWRDDQRLLEANSVTIYYPQAPLTKRHFIIATKKKMFRYLSQEEFTSALQMAQKIIRLLKENENELCLLAGGNVDGERARYPWHVEVILFDSSDKDSFSYENWKAQRRESPKGLDTAQINSYQRLFSEKIEN